MWRPGLVGVADLCRIHLAWQARQAVKHRMKAFLQALDLCNSLQELDSSSSTAI